MKLHPDQTPLSDKIQVKVTREKKNTQCRSHMEPAGQGKKEKKEKGEKKKTNRGHYTDQSRSPCINVKSQNQNHQPFWPFS